MPSRPRWLSFTSTISDSDPRWFTPPPARTAAFSRARRPGQRLARVPDPGAAAGCLRGGVDEAARQRGDARTGGTRKFSAVRSAVRIDASGPSTVPTGCRASTASPSIDPPLHDDRGVDLRERFGRACGSGEHTGLAGDERRPPALTRIEERGRDVAERDRGLRPALAPRRRGPRPDGRRSSQYVAHRSTNRTRIASSSWGSRPVCAHPDSLLALSRWRGCRARPWPGCASRQLRHRAGPSHRVRAPRRRRRRSPRGWSALRSTPAPVVIARCRRSRVRRRGPSAAFARR